MWGIKRDRTIVYREGTYYEPDFVGSSWQDVPGILADHLAVGDNIVWALKRQSSGINATYIRTG